MAWRYPDGAGTRRIEEKAVPEHAPAWLPRAFYKDRDWVLLNDAATLAWMANRASLELHVPFDRCGRPGYPTGTSPEGMTFRASHDSKSF